MLRLKRKWQVQPSRLMPRSPSLSRMFAKLLRIAARATYERRPRKPRFRIARCTRPENEPRRPMSRPRRAYMEIWELFEWHRANGTLAQFLSSFPELTR